MALSKRIVHIILTLLVASLQEPLWATHYRAGEITYRLLVGRTYEVTAITYTDPLSDADGSTVQIVLDWGDGSSSTIQRWGTENYPDNNRIRKNIYKATHTYKTDATYEIGMFDRNRVDGIININGGNTRDLAFFVSSIVKVNSSIGNNQSPTLLNPPIDKGCSEFVWVHNPAAFDADGDSLVFKLVPPKIGPGEDAPNFTLPAASDSFSLDAHTGRVYWSKPIKNGIYNIAIEVTEYRVFGTGAGRQVQIVGRIVRDMQIFIETCQNSPPVIDPLIPACVKVGDTISRVVSASDPNPGQMVRLTALGGPFNLGSQYALITPNPGLGMTTATTTFRWAPGCNAIRYEPYQLLFKAKDDYIQPLSDYNGFFLKVLGPALRNVKARQSGNDAFEISWKKDTCALAAKYYVYRRIDSSHWNPDACERGVPSYTDFLKIGEVSAAANPDDTTFTDNNKGSGLSPLIRYCYRVVAVYPARNESGSVIGGTESESVASAEVCNTIIRSKPIITKASVLFTDSLSGAVKLSWLKPDTLDTTNYKPPYTLVFKRGKQINTMSEFASASYASFSALTDSSLTDSLINTRDLIWYYQIELKAMVNLAEWVADVSPVASTVRSAVYSTDNRNILTWSAFVPWFNDSFIITRKNQLNVFEEIGRTREPLFSDTGLVNGVSYCYRIESMGAYPLLPLSIRNFSQEICGTPLDTVPPCPPVVQVVPPCSDFSHYENVLTWTQDSDCGNDIVSYRIYYKPNTDAEFEWIANLSHTTLMYVDSREELKKSIAGCYVVVGVDSFGNKSNFNHSVCIDNCPEYRLPNVFTPNGDMQNDLFKPFPYRFIDHIGITIYNRWGEEVFQSDDIEINWNGTDAKSGRVLSDGIYFYVCEVYENYLNGLRKRILKGTVQIIR